MTSRLIAGLFGMPGRSKTKSPATHRTGHELPGTESDFEPYAPRGTVFDGGINEGRLTQAMLLGLLMRR